MRHNVVLHWSFLSACMQREQQKEVSEGNMRQLQIAGVNMRERRDVLTMLRNPVCSASETSTRAYE